MPPKVSVNICCYNSEKYLKETIQSVLDQTVSDFEIVIINDGSTDRTEEIVKNFNDHRIRYFYQENRGLSYSRNRAISLSSGDYIAFLDHDDLWIPTKLEKQVAFLDKNADTGFVYSNFYIMDEIEGRRYPAFKSSQPKGQIFEKFLYEYRSGIVTVLIRRSGLSKLDSLFDINLKYVEDYDLFMRYLHANRACYIHEPLAFYRVHYGMSSLKLLSSAVSEQQYVIDKFKRLYSDFEIKYAHAIRYVNVRLEYRALWSKMAVGDLKSVRNNPAVIKSLYVKSILLYLASFLPVRVWQYLWDIRSCSRRRYRTRYTWAANLNRN